MHPYSLVLINFNRTVIVIEKHVAEAKLCCDCRKKQRTHKTKFPYNRNKVSLSGVCVALWSFHAGSTSKNPSNHDLFTLLLRITAYRSVFLCVLFLYFYFNDDNFFGTRKCVAYFTPASMPLYNWHIKYIMTIYL